MGAAVIVAVIELITLHLIDGRAVQINPAQVTHLQEARDGDNPKKQFNDKVDCVVRFTDGTYVAVAEECNEVRSLMEGEEP